MTYTEQEMTAAGCHGFGTRREQFTKRDAFIASVNQSPTMAALEDLALEVPNLVHNVSALPAALAVEARAQVLAPIAGGYLLTSDGQLEARAGEKGE
jgi:hypothetical protein